ncbi:MAG: hypothetical protein KDI09_21435, partial [Halioglobus sp.]|nr:hypothetical protein [Halioglobus sp.]
ILGPERFYWAFRKFIHDWSFRHPSPSDFFRIMNSAAGEDLSYFWRGWFMHNWSLDMAVKEVTYADGDTANGADVAIANLDRLVMPATVQVTFADGSSQRYRLSADSWLQRTVVTIHTDAGKRVAVVTIDPDQVIPDRDRSNNTMALQW